jgi:integrase
MADKLTDLQIRKAKPTDERYKLDDGKGLYLLVHPNGSKYWRLKYQLGGKEKLLAIGVYGEVSLGEARKARDAARALVREGRDPVIERRQRKAENLAELGTTLEVVAREWMTANAQRWSPAHIDKVRSILENNLFPPLGSLPVNTITPEMLLGVLRKIERRGALEIAFRVRQWSSAVFRYAIATGRAREDPAAVLRGALKTRTRESYASLGHDELGEFARRVGGYDGQPATRLGLMLLALTFVRPGELRAAEWSEFDLSAGEWRIPAERMKMRAPHIVPISRQAIEVLRDLKRVTGHSRWLFPNERRPETYVSENTWTYALYRLGYHGRATGHGFRASASTILNEIGFHADVIERQLAHAERNKIRAAYNKAQYLPERRTLMQEWADLVDLLKRDTAWSDLQAARNAGLSFGVVIEAVKTGTPARAFVEATMRANRKVIPGRFRRARAVA